MRRRSQKERRDMQCLVYYSYKISPHDHVNDHELKRLDHSISSLRKFNNEISVYLFCDNPEFIPSHFFSEYKVKVRFFEKGFVEHDKLFIYRWFNLHHFDDQSNTNILYVDSDTLFYGDVQYLFDHYHYEDVFGREEFGFRHDPNIGGGKGIRKSLDYVDQCIMDAGGVDYIYKYCMGVMLFNDDLHLDIVQRLGELVEIMNDIEGKKIPYPVPNPRIYDEYAMWVLLSRLGIRAGLFAPQDVTQGYVEQKHEEFFNPIVLHYTTKGEQRLAEEDERYSNLRRDVDEHSEHIDPFHIL